MTLITLVPIDQERDGGKGTRSATKILVDQVEEKLLERRIDEERQRLAARSIALIQKLQTRNSITSPGDHLRGRNYSQFNSLSTVHFQNQYNSPEEVARYF